MDLHLTDEIARFRAWAIGREGSSGEWECDYPEWQALYKAAETAYAAYASAPPDNTTKDLLLYAIARDNECQILSDALLQYPELLLALARHARAYPDWNARWQMPVILAEAGLPESPDLIRSFIEDEDEYVRRRSLMALAKYCPEEAEGIAIAAMDEKHEYTRIAALHVLFKVGSDRLQYFLDRHETDASEYVRQNVAELKARRADEFRTPG